MTDRDRLIELHTKAHNEWLQKEYDHETDKNLAEYCTDYLLANGVIVPPVEVGQTVYDIALGKICEWDIASYIIDSEGLSYINLAYMEGNNLCCNTYRIADIGKTVFLTKEDAEEKLKEINDNGNL